MIMGFLIVALLVDLFCYWYFYCFAFVCVLSGEVDLSILFSRLLLISDLGCFFRIITQLTSDAKLLILSIFGEIGLFLSYYTWITGFCLTYHLMLMKMRRDAFNM